jgi:predicted MFS family arabinose efflux permease
MEGAAFHQGETLLKNSALSLRRARWAVAAFFFINGSVVGAWVPHVPDRARALGLNPAQLGAILLSAGLGSVIAMPLAGILTGRFGSRAVTAVAASVFPVALAFVVLTPTSLLMALSLLCFGMAGAAMDVAMNSQGVLVEEHLGRRTISLFHALYSLGGVAGSAITSAALSQRVSPGLLTLLTSATLLLSAVVAGRFLLPHLDEHPHPRPHALRPHGRLLLLGILAFSSMVSEGAVADWSGIFLRAVRGLGEGVVGYGFTAFAAAMVTGRLTGDRVVARIGEKQALRFGGLLGIAGLLAVLFCPQFSLNIAGFALLGLGLANSSPILYRAAGKIPGVPPGAGIATTVGIGYAGLLAGPPALGFVGHAAGISRIFVVLTGLCLMLALAAPLVSGAAPKKLQEP